MQNFFNLLLVLNRRKAFSVFLTAFLVCSHPAQAQSEEGIESNLSPGIQSEVNQDDWVQFPYTIQFRPRLGAIYKNPQLPALEDSQNTKYWLGTKGVSLDVGILQIRRFLHRRFHVYPKLGIALNCSWLENKGSFTGEGVIYLEPQYSYQARWEMFPRLGVGIAYAHIPDKLFINNLNDRAASPATSSAQDAEQGGIHWDLSFALVTRINLASQWQLSPSIGFSYLPPLVAEEQSGSLTDFSASIVLGYTPNPSLISYPSQEHDKRSRINVGWLSTFKKFTSSAQTLADQPKNVENEARSYYIGGPYGQWSLQVCNNHAVTLATEWIHDGVAEQILKTYAMSSAFKISILGGHEFRWGKLLFGQKLGFYIMNNEASLSSGVWEFYTRLGLDYKLTDFLAVGTSLKTKVHISSKQENFITLATDFLDFRVSYIF